MLSINTNLSSLIAQRSMKQSTNKLNQAIERMTTGYKINHSKDNAANYSISTNLTTKIGSYNVAEDNCAMGLDLIATAEGSLSQIQDKLQRLRDLQEQASNGTYGEESLNAINSEANALVDEINRLYNTAEYNGLKLFGADSGSPIATFATPRASTSSSAGFIKQITRRNTASMTALADVNESTALADGSYSISTAEELVKLSTMTNAGLVSSGDEFVLVNDIDLNGIDWVPIGVDYAFTGTFDGNGFVILNASTYQAYDYMGFFSQIEGGEVKNLGLLVNAVSDYYVLAAGNIAGKITNTNITNCYVDDAYMVSFNTTGGLVGIANNSTIDSCYTNNVYMQSWCAGGLVCDFNDGTLRNSFVEGGTHSPDMGNLSPPYYTGELIYDATSVNASNCYADIYGVSSYITSINETPDWNGTPFTLYQATGDSYILGGGGGTSTPPTYAPDTILLQVGMSSNWGSQVGVSTNFVLNNVDDLRMIGLDKTTDYLSIIDDMLELVSEKQTHFGSVSNRLGSVLEEIIISRDDLISSRSTLRDADISEVSSEYIRQQILQQASATLLATANQSAGIALQLI